MKASKEKEEEMNLEEYQSLKQENQMFRETLGLGNEVVYRQQMLLQLNQISQEIKTLTKWIHYFATSGEEGNEQSPEPEEPEEPD